MSMYIADVTLAPVPPQVGLHIARFQFPAPETNWIPEQLVARTPSIKSLTEPIIGRS